MSWPKMAMIGGSCVLDFLASPSTISLKKKGGCKVLVEGNK